MAQIDTKTGRRHSNTLLPGNCVATQVASTKRAILERGAPGGTMKFDVYGRFQVEVRREDDNWVAYQIALGKRTRVTHFAIPQEIQTAAEIARYLDDLYHEAARPGQSVSVVAE
jgi:hypothetical protein